MYFNEIYLVYAKVIKSSNNEKKITLIKLYPQKTSRLDKKN